MQVQAFLQMAEQALKVRSATNEALAEQLACAKSEKTRVRRRGPDLGGCWCSAAAAKLLMLSVSCVTHLKNMRHLAAVEAVSSVAALAAGVHKGLNTLPPLTTLPDWPGGEDKQRSPGGEQLPG